LEKCVNIHWQKKLYKNLFLGETMKKVTLELEDEMFAKIAAIARQAGIAEKDTDEWFSQQIQQRLGELLPSGGSRWMPREQWDALVRGEDCAFCRQLAQEDDFDGYGFNVADLHVSRLRLTRNQYIRGECILTYKRHVKELHDLTQEERCLFTEDLACSTRAIEKVFAPLKMCIDTGSSGYPHLYFRLKPRYYDDAAPGERMSHVAERILRPEEYAQYISQLRLALAE
jgi:diadenosine tetraphosphate (Ap4A) HIT family hydrolase